MAKINFKRLVSMEPEPDYLVCVKDDGVIFQLGDPFYSMSAARAEIWQRKMLDSSMELFVIKETKKREILKNQL